MLDRECHLTCCTNPVCLVGVLACSPPRPRLHLPQAGQNVPDDGGSRGSLLGGLVRSLVALYPHVARDPVQSGPPPLRGQVLQAAQYGGDELHVVSGVRLLQELQRRPGVCAFKIIS